MHRVDGNIVVILVNQRPIWLEAIDDYQILLEEASEHIARIKGHTRLIPG